MNAAGDNSQPPSLGLQQPQGPGGATESQKPNCDVPPFSRVFVVCSRNHKEDDIKRAFEPFGIVEDVWMVKDRMTKESKGICYVKYDKASSAALAIESLDGTVIGDEIKPVKVCYLLFLSYHSNICLSLSPSSISVLLKIS